MLYFSSSSWCLNVYYQLTNLQVKDGVSEYLEDGGYLRVRIQWEQSFQLFQSTYRQYDEVVKIHNQQMR